MAQFSGTNLVCFRGERTVFKGLDFSLESGGMLHLRGANGSGKSSLLRILSGLLPMAAGELHWDGQPVRKDADAQRARIAYVGHQDAIKGALNVRENIEFWQAMGGRGATPSADQALAQFNLESLAELPARFLSAGQKRRLNLARLAAIPRVLWLLDEPANSLDTASEALLESQITQHRDAGGMAIMASHARRVDDGEVLVLGDFAGTGADLFEAAL